MLAARLHMDGTYRTIKDGQPLAIHPSSVLYTERPPKYVVYQEVQLTSENYMRELTAIEPQWLSEIAPHYYRRARRPEAASLTPRRYAPVLPKGAPGHANDEDGDNDAHEAQFVEKRTKFDWK